MTFPLDRYFASGERKVNADPNGDLVWFDDANFNERQAREQAIRDCIAAVQRMADEWPAWASVGDVPNALRALLERGSR